MFPFLFNVMLRMQHLATHNKCFPTELNECVQGEDKTYGWSEIRKDVIVKIYNVICKVELDWAHTSSAI